MNRPDEAVLALVRDRGHALLMTHCNPDADALGSLLGLAEMLEGQGKQVLSYLEEPVSPLYRFLPGAGRPQTDMARVREFVNRAADDLVSICLDCGDEGRLGRESRELMSFRPLAVIDHHQGNFGFGDCHWIEPHRSSTQTGAKLYIVD